VLGLAGVVVAVSPAGGGGWPGVAAVLLSVVAGSGAVIVTRQLKGAPEVQMMTFYAAGLAVTSAPLALWSWVPVDGATLAVLASVGIVAQVAQLCFIRAHWLAEAGVLAPLGYLGFVASALVGWTVFGEPLGWATALGAVIIAGSSWLTLGPSKSRSSG
ncbi:MAG: DMT family transporter, partial [Pseudomonadota bacterium]